jgi:hypothetical protein
MQFPNANDVAGIASIVDGQKRATISAAIWTAAETPGTVTTGALNLSSLSQLQFLGVCNELQQLGYSISFTADQQLTINWPSAA